MKRSHNIPNTPEEYLQKQIQSNLNPGDKIKILPTKATDWQIIKLGIFWNPEKRKAIGQTHTVDQESDINDPKGIYVLTIPDPEGGARGSRYYPFFMLKKI